MGEKKHNEQVSNCIVPLHIHFFYDHTLIKSSLLLAVLCMFEFSARWQTRNPLVEDGIS